MTSRGRGGSISDWDPMRDDFNDSSFNAHYPDDNASDTQVDFTKLYVTKLPLALSQEGLVDLFSKYGTVIHSFYSRNINKRYAFIGFETPGEARIAMMKLNKTEPFCMNIIFAHKKSPPGGQPRTSQPNVNMSSNSDGQMRRFSNIDRVNHNMSIIEDSTSISSRGRNIEHSNGNDDPDDTEASELGHDPKLGYDLEKIKLQRLEIMDQQLEVQQRMLIHQQRMKRNASISTKRRLLPDGRSIQITRDIETSVATGGGDSRNIPGLQRVASRCCVSCGAVAELYCAGCRVTPYCGERCQRCDWDARHRAVCHNLARSSTDEAETPVSPPSAPDIPTVAPLRQPHPPVMRSPRDPASDSGSEREGKKFLPPAETHAAFQQSQRRGNQIANNRNRQENSRYHGNPANKKDQQGGQDENAVYNSFPASSNRRHTPSQQSTLRQPAKQSTPERTEPTPPEPKPESTKSTVNASRLASIGDVTPRKPLVPTTYVVEKLSAGAEFLAEVVAMASDCGSKQFGCVCLTLHNDYSEMYNQLCDDFKEQCQMDKEVYSPRIGETFAYLEEDGFWYRARCVARTRAALLDSGRVISFTPSACRRLPPSFATFPEFMAVLKTKDLAIGSNVSCKVISLGDTGIAVSVEDGSGSSVQVEATRWTPDIEYTNEVQHSSQSHANLEQPTPAPQTTKPVQVKTPPPTIPSGQQRESQVTESRTKDPVSSRRASEAERQPLVPANYVVEKLSVGAVFLAEVVAMASECGSKQLGCVCLTLHGDYSEMYDQLCDDFKELCQKDDEAYTPRIGETFAYFCKEDSYWYRARCLARTRAALLDAGRVVSLSPGVCRRLPPRFAAVPEFMALLKTKDFEIGSNVSCKVISFDDTGIVVSVDDGSGRSVQVEVTRWTPEIEYTDKPVAAPKSTSVSLPTPMTAPTPIIAEVPRPALERNAIYTLLDVTSLRRACLRPCDPRPASAFDTVLQDTVLYGVNAIPLKEPPVKGQTVVAKFIEDGTHYRAFVKRVNANMNKCLIEYIEYGNEEVVPLDRLYVCPRALQLDQKPAIASLVKLSDREPAALTTAAVKYIDTLKDNACELILTIPGGAKTAPSGSLVSLILAKNCEPVSKKIEDFCIPEWKKIAERGGDVLEMESRFYSQLKYSIIPTTRPFTLRVTYCNASQLMRGAVCGYEKGNKTAELAYEELTKQIKEYCESPLCKEPYLPKIEELCIAKNTRDNAWVRSVLLEYPQGAGSRTGSMLHLDCGQVEDVSVANLRRIPPELVDPYPALANHLEIKNFPNKVTDKQIESALRFMKITPEGTGELCVRACRVFDVNMYELDAPELIAILTQ